MGTRHGFVLERAVSTVGPRYGGQALAGLLCGHGAELAGASRSLKELSVGAGGELTAPPGSQLRSGLQVCGPSQGMKSLSVCCSRVLEGLKLTAIFCLHGVCLPRSLPCCRVGLPRPALGLKPDQGLAPRMECHQQFLVCGTVLMQIESYSCYGICMYFCSCLKYCNFTIYSRVLREITRKTLVRVSVLKEKEKVQFVWSKCLRDHRNGLRVHGRS